MSRVLHYGAVCLQWVTRGAGNSTQHGCDMKTRSPEELWREIAAEVGGLDQLDRDGLCHALDLAAVEAFLSGDRESVRVPRVIVERMLADLQAQQRGQSTRPKHRPKDNWWLRRWKETACQVFEQRRRELRLAGLSPSDAIERAAIDVAPRCCVTPATILSWVKHPHRRRSGVWRKVIRATSRR
jgi:hypothetical protein